MGKVGVCVHGDTWSNAKDQTYYSNVRWFKSRQHLQRFENIQSNVSERRHNLFKYFVTGFITIRGECRSMLCKMCQKIEAFIQEQSSQISIWQFQTGFLMHFAYSHYCWAWDIISWVTHESCLIVNIWCTHCHVFSAFVLWGGIVKWW